MKTSLRLVSSNPCSQPHERLSARGLHLLADQCTHEVQAGRTEAARFLACKWHLPPIGIAALATWMTHAGLSEDEILRVVG